jgi:hydrogenase maturation factor
VSGAAPSRDQHHCITCGDDGEPMMVIRVDDKRGLALCRDGAGGDATVETALVDSVAPGELLLVHAGTAIARLAPEESV